MQLRKLSNYVGAEINGIALNRLSKSAISSIKQAFSEYGVLVFRGQEITPEEHRAFAQSFGDIVINPFLTPLPDHPDIAELRKEPHHTNNIGDLWHTDTSYQEEPCLGSILVARELPPVGGDTLFAGMAAAYEALSDGLKETLGGLRAIHSSVESFGAGFDVDREHHESRFINPEKATHTVSHPLVITHPLSGRKCLFVNPDFTTQIEGWTKAESTPLLEFLCGHATSPRFTCCVQWEEGSVAFWDNRATLHCALNDYAGYRRVMHRITLAGTRLG